MVWLVAAAAAAAAVKLSLNAAACYAAADDVVHVYLVVQQWM